MDNTEREKLRAARKLKLIDDADQGSSVEYAANGVYGFTSSPDTASAPLFGKQTFQIFELHKLVDGSIHLVGYMTGPDADALGAARDMAELKLYPEAHQQATRLVSVPAESIHKAKPASRENGNWMSFLLNPR